MRKFVVPIVALAGIALLSPRADAANLMIKSRAAVQGKPVSLPVMVNNVGGSGELWGVDLAMSFDSAKLNPVIDSTTGAAFTPQAVTGSTETPVVVSGAPVVGSGTNPTLYVGYVRGTAAMPTTAGTGNPTNGIGLLRFSVASGTALKTLIPLTVPATYNVANDGTGSTNIARAGATGATSTATSGAAVAAEAVTVLDYMPGATAPSGSDPDYRAPLNKVYVCGGPGDINGDGSVNATDFGILVAVMAKRNPAPWVEGARIAADIAPANGYLPTNIGGTNGAGYGDGMVTASDFGLMVAKMANRNPATFPVSE